MAARVGLAGAHCNQQYFEITDKYILCEIKPAMDTPVSATSVQLTDVTSQPGSKLVECPSGHVTHDFLACDLKSNCFVHDVSSSFSCQTLFVSFPPHFACADGTGYVPYSLVCDYRQDCRDNSDEGFCVVRPCVLAGMFECDNGQVGVQCVGVVSTECTNELV